MTIDDRFSAWLDGELTADEAAAVEAELAADPALAADVDSLRAVRSLLRAEGGVDLSPGAGATFIARVEAATAHDAAPPHRDAGVTELALRRRLPALAAVAASFIILVSVIGGVGGPTTLPAVGDLIARHDAAAAEMPGGPMTGTPDDMPAMAGDMEMMLADEEGGVVHAVYVTGDGAVVSVFRQEGEFRADRLARDMGGDVGEMDGHDMWAADIGLRHVAVLDGDGYVWTIVSDADVDPMADLMGDMMDELPERSPTIAERLRDVVGVVVEPFELGE